MDSNKTDEEKSVSLLHVRLKAKCKEQNINIDVAAKDVLQTTYSTLRRRLISDEKLKTPFVILLAEFLDVSKDEVIEWHNNRDDSNQTPDIPQNIGKIKAFFIISILILFVVLTFFISTSGASLKQESNTYTSKFNGDGIDIGLSDIEGLEDFHSQLFKYEFEDLESTISGENITVKAKILYTLISQPDISYIGNFSASGHYLNGNAALTYKVTIEANQEAWIGVMMVKMPTIGDSKGYWLTIHTDPDDKSFGDFAFGNAKLTRAIQSSSEK